jgi:predicted kinase
MLIVLGELPGVGKTTLARALSQHLHATHIRVDTIEQAIKASGMLRADVGPAGYMVAYAVAEDNLRGGKTVVAESVLRQSFEGDPGCMALSCRAHLICRCGG